MQRLTLLVVDDDPGLRRALQLALGGAGYRIVEADGVEAGLEAYRRETPDLVVLDHALGDGTAFDLLDGLARLGARVPVVVLAGSGTVEIAVQAMKRGVRDFLAKPVRPALLLAAVERALALPGPAPDREPPPDAFAGTSPAVRALAAEAGRAAASSQPVLIQGEPGVGKGVLARWVHDHGPRAGGPFTAVSCAGVPPEILEAELFGHEPGHARAARTPRAGLLEASAGGTLFLDDLGELDLALQGKVLALLEHQRFRRKGGIEDRRADVRVIAATHRDLPARVEAHAFRAELLSSVGALSLAVPPLRERPEDIPHLVSSILAVLPTRSRGISLAPATVTALQAARWPGNVRELRNTLERAVLRHQDRELSPADLELGRAPEAPAPARPVHAPAAPPAAAFAPTTLRDVERALILEVLQEESFRVVRASARLGIPRSTLYQKLREFGLRLPPARRRI